MLKLELESCWLQVFTWVGGKAPKELREAMGNSEVRVAGSETEMLRSWLAYWKSMDPDGLVVFQVHIPLPKNSICAIPYHPSPSSRIPKQRFQQLRKQLSPTAKLGCDFGLGFLDLSQEKSTSVGVLGSCKQNHRSAISS